MKQTVKKWKRMYGNYSVYDKSLIQLTLIAVVMAILNLILCTILVF